MDTRKVLNPSTGTKIDVPVHKYVLRMKAGTTGTLEDPHRPEIMDSLEGKPHEWSINQELGYIEVAAESAEHTKIAKKETAFNG